MLAAAAGFAVLPQIGDHQPARADGSDRRVRHHHAQAGARPGRWIVRPGVEVETRAPRGAIVPGRTYRWPYSVTNHGTSPVKNVTFAATPDRDLKVRGAPPRCRWRHTAMIVCQVGLIPRGQTRRGSFTATVNPKAHTGRTLSSPARVYWLRAPAGAATTRTTAFPPVAVSPATPGKAASGSPYQVSVTNDGPVTAESVVVRGEVAPDGPCAGSCDNPGVSAVAMPCGSHSCGDSCGCRQGGVWMPQVVEAPRVPRIGDFPRIGGPCGGGPCFPGTGGSCGLSSCGETPNGSCGPCAAGPAREYPQPPAGRVILPGRSGDVCGAGDRESRACGSNGFQRCGERGSCGAAPVRLLPVRILPAPAAPPRHDRGCVARSGGFACRVGRIPPGRTRTLPLIVHGRPHAPARRFGCESATGGRAAACHTRRARPLAARPSAPHLPVTGGAFGEMALWGLGVTGIGLALFGLGRRRRQQG